MLLFEENKAVVEDVEGYREERTLLLVVGERRWKDVQLRNNKDPTSNCRKLLVIIIP